MRPHRRVPRLAPPQVLVVVVVAYAGKELIWNQEYEGGGME